MPHTSPHTSHLRVTIIDILTNHLQPSRLIRVQCSEWSSKYISRKWTFEPLSPLYYKTLYLTNWRHVQGTMFSTEHFKKLKLRHHGQKNYTQKWHRRYQCSLPGPRRKYFLFLIFDIDIWLRFFHCLKRIIWLDIITIKI